MTDETANLVLEQLRIIRADIDEVRQDLRRFHNDVDQRFDNMNQRFAATNLKVDGVAMLMMTLAGHVNGMDDRITLLEGRAPAED